MRKQSALLAVVAILCLGIFAAAAQAVEWAGNGYYLVSGQNGFLNHKVWLYAADGIGEGVASCAGIREVAKGCAGPWEVSGYVLSGDVWSEPYLHNHDTKAGTFKGYYYS